MTGTLSSLLVEAEARLEGTSDSPRLDAELLLCHALGRERSYLHSHPESRLEPGQARRFEALIAARGRGEPIAYLTSKREFWSLPLKVTPATLIPRPETERLVELALERIPRDRPTAVLDLGTGSGAIAFAIASERPRARVTATDRSTEALEVARENASILKLHDIEWLEGDWYAPVAGRRFAAIVSNPPYVREGDPHLAEGDLRFEPGPALIAGVDGLRDLREIVDGAPGHLDDGGVLLLEHGLDQGPVVRVLLSGAGFSHVETWRDVAGHERVTGGKWAKARASG